MTEDKDILSNKKSPSEGKEQETTETNNEETSKPGIFSNINLRLLLGEKGYEFYKKNFVTSILLVVVFFGVLLGTIGYNYIYKDFFEKPANEKSIEKLWQAETKALDEQDWLTAIEGDSLGFYNGFKQIAKKYSGNKGGEIAQYDLGIAYLNNKEYENAIDALKKVNFDDELLSTITLGAIGDAYLQLGAVTDALEFYTKAFERRDNDLSSPIYMMKAALCHEIEGNYDNAITIYRNLYLKYPNSILSIKAEKYMESLKLGQPVYSFDANKSK
jgi:tetratricopeptide (TPR) repeat protein